VEAIVDDRRLVNFACLEQGRGAAGNIFGLAERDTALTSEGDAIDDAACQFAPQIVASLATNGEDFDSLAFCFQPACQVARPILALNAPANPRSAVTAIKRWVWFWPVPARRRDAAGESPTEAASVRSMRSIRSA
jgi:hypothetical protein